MAQLFSTSTEVTQRVSRVGVGVNFTDNDGITSNEIVSVQVVSQHLNDLFVASAFPIAGTMDLEITLNRDLIATDPIYPDGTGTLYAELHIIVIAPRGTYTLI